MNDNERIGQFRHERVPGAQSVTPVITAEFDVTQGRWVLLDTRYGLTTPAGPRLFKEMPHPPVAFVHDTREDAERDAALLAKYVGEPRAKLRQSTGEFFF